MEFAPEVVRRGSTVYVGSPNRTACAVVGMAIAIASQDPVIWLDVRNTSGADDEYEPLIGERVAPGRRLRTRTPSDLAPDLAARDHSVWTLIRSDEPARNVARLIDFLRLPHSVQSLVSELPAEGAGTTLLVTNVDRIAPFYPEEMESTRRFLDTLTSESVKLVVTNGSGDRKDRFAWDFVFRIEGPAGRDWRRMALHLEKGSVPRNAAGATPTELRDIPSIGALVATAPDGEPSR